MPPSNADQFPEGVGVCRIRHFARAEVDPSAKITLPVARSGQRRVLLRRWVNASVKPVAASTSSRRSVMRVGGICCRDRAPDLRRLSARRLVLDMQNAVFNQAAGIVPARAARPSSRNRMSASLPVCQPFLRPQWHSETTAFRDGLCRNEYVFRSP